MSKSIEQIRDELLSGAGGVARGARRIVLWQAVLWWLCVGLAALLLLLLGDMLLRREELGLRLLSWLAWLIVLTWGALKLLRPAWQFAPSPQQVARWLEHERPESRQQLATAVELAQLPASDGRYGSPVFRQQALQQWAAAAHSPDWRQLLQLSGLRRAGLALLLIAIVGVMLALVWPAEMRVAMTRLAVPWNAQPWPRRDQLQLVDPPRVVAVGSQWQLEIVDQRPPLPEQVVLQMRDVGSEIKLAYRTLETVAIGDVAVGNLPAIQAAIEVRAVGGDDQRMAWHRIEVVQPPQLTEYQFAVEPPAYTGLPPATVEGQRISVLAGSQVEFTGVFDQAVTQVKVQPMLNRQSESSPSELPANTPTVAVAASGTEAHAPQTSTAEWTVTLEEDGRRLNLTAPSGQPLELQQAMSWQLSISTSSGLEVLQPERWSIDVAADTPPRVEQLLAEMGEVAPQGRLVLRGEASDDLQLTAVIARLKIFGQEAKEPARMPIWLADAAAEVGGRTASKEALPIATGAAPSIRRQVKIDATWDLSELESLAAGQRFSVCIEACDSAGQWSQSRAQEFDVRDPQDLVQSVQDQQSQLLARVRELVDTQRRNSQLFSQAWETAQQSQQVKREQIDLFRNAAQVQRELEEQVAGEGVAGSMLERVAELREILENNRLDGTDLAQAMSALHDNLRAAGAGGLRSATTATDQTSQQAQQAIEAKDGVTSELANAASEGVASQADALRTLEKLLDRLAESESALQLERELGQILNQQNALRRDTDQLQLERMSNSSSQDSGELDARQSALSADQQGLARRLDAWVARNSQLPVGQDTEQQALSAALKRVADGLVESQATEQMRRSTEEIRDGQLNRAAATQMQVSQLLEESLRQLGAGNQSQLGNLRSRADDLWQTGQELSSLAAAQAELAERWNGDDARPQSQALQDQQQGLREQTLTSALKATQSGDAGLAGELDSVAEKQRQASQAGEQSQTQLAAQSASAAAQQLEQAAKQTQLRAAAMEQQAAEQQMFQLATALAQLVAQQQPVTQTFRQLATAASQASNENTLQRASMRETAAQQESVRQLLRDVRGETTELPAFDWTLGQAEESMARAAASAQRYRIEPDAREAADAAYRFLELAAQAMQESKAGGDAASQAGEPAAQPEGQQPTQEQGQRPLPFLASIKLLRSLQQEINRQTVDAQAMEDQLRRSRWLTELARMQQSLGEQTEHLLREASANSHSTLRVETED